jgi:hypothetical protein
MNWSISLQCETRSTVMTDMPELSDMRELEAEELDLVEGGSFWSFLSDVAEAALYGALLYPTKAW